MIGAGGDGVAPVPEKEVAERKRLVPADHLWTTSARPARTYFEA